MYRDVLGSDVINDGMYVELRDSSGVVVATVFRSDVTGQYEVHFDPADAPREVIDHFVQRAKETLASRALSA
jgi:hypothetical protein